MVGTRGNLRSSGNKDGCGNNDSRKLSERNRRLCHRWRRVKNFVTLGPIPRGFDRGRKKIVNPPLEIKLAYFFERKKKRGRG